MRGVATHGHLVGWLSAIGFSGLTLVELQGALQSYARSALAIGEARHAEASAAGGGDRWDGPTLTPELWQANRKANMAIASLSALVLDDEVRRLCQEVLASAAQIWLAESPDEADRGVAATINAATAASTTLRRRVPGDLRSRDRRLIKAPDNDNLIRPPTYFAYSTARVSRMTVTLIWPG